MVSHNFTDISREETRNLLFFDSNFGKCVTKSPVKLNIGMRGSQSKDDFSVVHMRKPITLREKRRQHLEHFIATEGDTMQPTLRMYLFRAGLATMHSIDSAMQDLWQDVVVQALNHSDRFDPNRQPKAWLLGIASNLIKRRQDEAIKREQREPLVRDMRVNQGDTMGDDDLFDLLTQAQSDDPAQQVEAQDTINHILGSLSQSDQDLIRLAVINDLNSEMLAEALGIKAGTVRVRLHRALNRLRKSLIAQDQHDGYISAQHEVDAS